MSQLSLLKPTPFWNVMTRHWWQSCVFSCIFPHLWIISFTDFRQANLLCSIFHTIYEFHKCVEERRCGYNWQTYYNVQPERISKLTSQITHKTKKKHKLTNLNNKQVQISMNNSLTGTLLLKMTNFVSFSTYSNHKKLHYDLLGSLRDLSHLVMSI